MPVFQIDYVNDDGGTRFGGKDSRLHFEAPADGTYFLRLRDVRGLEGERFAYRLTAREPAPDYSIAFDPRSFNIPRGGRVSVTVTAERKDGFNGPIDVRVRRSARRPHVCGRPHSRRCGHDGADDRRRAGCLARRRTRRA